MAIMLVTCYADLVQAGKARKIALQDFRILLTVIKPNRSRLKQKCLLLNWMQYLELRVNIYCFQRGKCRQLLWYCKASIAEISCIWNNTGINTWCAWFWKWLHMLPQCFETNVCVDAAVQDIMTYICFWRQDWLWHDLRIGEDRIIYRGRSAGEVDSNGKQALLSESRPWTNTCHGENEGINGFDDPSNLPMLHCKANCRPAKRQKTLLEVTATFDIFD